MKRYCFDTSGITNPLHDVPEDIHPTLWGRIARLIEAGDIAVTTEIYGELKGTIWSPIGSVIDSNSSSLILDIGQSGWNYAVYAAEAPRMIQDYRKYISEYMPRQPDNTVCLNDMSIIALAKATGLPLVSMESSAGNSSKYKRIPDICALEQVVHLDFNSFLRKEGIKI